MKTNYLKIISAVVIGLFVLSTSVRAVGEGRPEEGKSITKEEAAKSYPPPKGGYPLGERDLGNPGMITSPYPPHQIFDCRQIGRGMLVLDTRAKKVFVKP